MTNRIIVSLTSFPARINSVAQSLATIYAQTVTPDAVVLYLAKEQFPARCDDLPEELTKLVEEKRLEIVWVDEDLGPHKKYFYAFRDYPDDAIITVDDDMLYPSDMIELLANSYRDHPNAVSALRVHLITTEEDGSFRPYDQWRMEFDGLVGMPSLRLFATGAGGCLYPASLFKSLSYNSNDVMAEAPTADDLWLKGLELKANIPVVLPRPHRPLQYVPDTQSVGLYHVNVLDGGNDRQWKKTLDFLGVSPDGRLVENSSPDNARELNCAVNYLVDLLADEDSKALDARNRIKRLETWLKEARSSYELEKSEADRLRSELNKVYSSRTWKAGRAVSAPYRFLAKAIRR